LPRSDSGAQRPGAVSATAPLLRELTRSLPFPDPEAADEHGLLAYGGDLSAERLLSAYAQGVFPWYESGPILWFSPDPRLALVPGQLHITRSLAKTLRSDRYELRLDTSFEAVIRHCAEAPRPGQSGTWITPEMLEAYCGLHELGFAHCVEAWDEGELVGGLYGVSLGAGFFGESMFAHRDDASKVALVWLVRQLEAWDFDFVDCQVYTDHLARFGAREWSRRRFLEELDRTLEVETRRGPWKWSEGFAPEP
jgi:leucyl/phenylalanyl-tRNA--protein transferase